MLKGEDSLLPARSSALAGFAETLTERPWSITAEHTPAGLGVETADLAPAGLGVEEVETAIGVVAMFNYLTRVADASGIEFDYSSPLPAFQPERGREPAVRPDRDSWPVVTAELRTFPSFPAMTEAWQQWRDYVFNSDTPLAPRERRLLARAAAQETCDRWRADELAAYSPANGTETLLDSFARKLSRAPWRMAPADLQTLRDTGYSEPALLHAISVVALQNAESRLAMGRALTT